MKKESLYFLLIIYILIFFLIHIYYGYFDFIFILLFLFFFIEFKSKNISIFILSWLILLIYYLIRYFILFENWSLLLLFFVPFFLFIKKEYFKKINHPLAFTIFITLLVFVIFAFYKSGIFYNEPLIINDYPYHLYRAWLVTDVLIPKFGNIIGWVPYFQAGYRELYDYPPGEFILTYFIKQITLRILTTELSFRIVIFLSFILSIFSIFIFSYSFTKSLWAGIISSIFWVAWTHYYFFESFVTGYYSLSFILLSLVFYKLWADKNKLKYFILSCLFSGLTSLFHPEMFLYNILLIFLLHFIFLKKRKIFYPFLLTLISLSIGAVYLSEGFLGLADFRVSIDKQINFWPAMFEIKNIFFNEYLYQFTIPFFLTVFGSATIYLLFNKNEKIKKDFSYLLFNVTFQLILLFIIYFLQAIYPYFPFSILRIQRTSYILRVFIITLASFSIVNILKKLNMNKTFDKMLIGLIVCLILIFTSLNMAYFYNTISSSNYSQFEKIYWGNTFQEVYQLNLTKGNFAFEPKKGVLELMNWLNNEDIKERVLIEDSTSRSLGGQVLGLFAMYTNKSFIGGPFPMIQIADYDRDVYEGYFFNKPIQEYNLSEFEKRLNDFNVKYLVVWNKNSITFLNNFPEVFKKINVTSDELFHIYLYEKAVNSYTEPIENISIKFIDSNVEIEKNGHLDKDIIIKLTYYPNWHAYVNGKEIQIEEDDRSFIKISKTVCEKCNINLVYEEGTIERVGELVSILSFLFLIFLFIFTYLKNK